MISKRVIIGFLVWAMIMSRPLSVRGDIPPLTDAQIARLEAAQDGQDHREDAFEALMENMELSDGEAGDSLIRLNPELDAMTGYPADFRGDLCLLTGIIQQQAVLPAPYETVSEWFLRDDDGEPMIIYIAGLPGGLGSGFQDGTRIRIIARFYKRVDFIARDGMQRSYPAFVGAKPKPLGLNGGDSLNRMWTIVIPVSLLAMVFIILFVYVRYQKGRPPRHATALTHESGVDEADSLSDDPAQALSELRKRADNQPSLPSHDPSE